ncbi:tRNA (adenosine(37)-N6)-dimethylallyltransferase MiaA [Clostridium sp. MCC353]|uniref:tRNA (adenosine(37)-N6)-dimethylallyltransferase MiaA n=1 Tax=Clostridium sp. MCC353 TaxID=2592646 RepID=UPI001C03082A|nr:tRNA (adenosine(37)-N6)-dimethylallyltransferase MiaA [Clostridium sp. MCC353]MBT9776995.1 tRNA (adenosine(37)-N6)-dimethylallyltransferase MiaA [Clostridium sp. MCC353]
MKQPIIILTGPTAVGKTALSIELAHAVGGEIISADSMQVYRHMDIGSAKIRPEEMDGVPHHLIDVLEPTEDFNVVVFQSMAKEALSKIYSAAHVPIVTGGTGFYIQALLYDIDFKEDDGDSRIRRELEELAAEQGAEFMHGLLAQIDPESADAIHPNNQKRVIRAIEYYRLTGEKISAHNEEERKKESPYRFLYYVINTDREKLYSQIDLRVDQMIENGLIDEVEKLASMGCEKGMVSMQGLGYKEILDYLNGECTLEEAIYVLKRDTRHFAKRQLTWFKRERDVRWLNLPEFGYDRSLVLKKILDDVENERWS